MMNLLRKSRVNIDKKIEDLWKIMETMNAQLRKEMEYVKQIHTYPGN